MIKHILEEEKIFIIGSLTQEDHMRDIAKKYSNAKYVHKQPEKSFEQLVSEAFDNIDDAETVIALHKPDGSFGQGTTYELEYAKRLNKNIQIVD